LDFPLLIFNMPPHRPTQLNTSTTGTCASLVDLMWKDGTPVPHARTRRLDIKTDAPGKTPRHTRMLDIRSHGGEHTRRWCHRILGHTKLDGERQRSIVITT
jgi:hypothetical protein